MTSTGHIWRVRIRGYARPRVAGGTQRVLIRQHEPTRCVTCGKEPKSAGAQCGGKKKEE